MGQFPIELVRSVVPASSILLWHPDVKSETLGLENLADDEWILFPQRLNPIVHDAIVAVARRDGVKPKCTHHAVTAEQAVHLVLSKSAFAS
jgi:hypothetical protein